MGIRYFISILGLSSLFLHALARTAFAVEIELKGPAVIVIPLAIAAIPLGWLIRAMIQNAQEAAAREKEAAARRENTELQEKLKNAAESYRVWYATNRRLVDGAFIAEIDTQMHYGTIDLGIPKSHKFGSTGSSWLTLGFRKVVGGPDDRIFVADGEELSLDAFLDSIQNALGSLKSDVLVYIHGYAVSFPSAIIRAAQIGFDLKIKGVVTAFCWASRGETTASAYLTDAETVGSSVTHLADFLADLHDRFPEKRINLMAHSMGNKALAGVFESLKNYSRLENAKFGQILLAAPDIDVKLFKRIASVYPQVSERTTLYVCSKDYAVKVSAAIHDGARVGFTPPVTVADGIDTVDASSVDLDIVGHSYYAESEGVLYDMAQLIKNNEDPDGRLKIERAETDSGERYWRIKE